MVLNPGSEVEGGGVYSVEDKVLVAVVETAHEH
jgi:hypothetical protein